MHIRIDDPSLAGEARRLAVSVCRDLHFTELRTNQVALVVTELATNLIKHTQNKGGELILSPIELSGLTALDILSLDKAAGIVNIGESLRDGYSTTGTQGGGLGAIYRLSDSFDIFSAPQQGTVLFSRIWQHPPDEMRLCFDLGAVCLPLQGEQACGDGWSMKKTKEATFFLLADGLGHGENAAIAANQAIAIFQDSEPNPPKQLVLTLHQALKDTRGAAIAIVECAFGQGLVRFAGLGNISARILTEKTDFNLLSHNGTAGINAPHIQEFTYPWTEDSVMVLHSDGVATHWSLNDYRGLQEKHPALIAGVLFRDFQRLKDDSTVVIIKAKPRFCL